MEAAWIIFNFFFLNVHIQVSLKGYNGYSESTALKCVVFTFVESCLQRVSNILHLILDFGCGSHRVNTYLYNGICHRLEEKYFLNLTLDYHTDHKAMHNTSVFF